MYSTGISISEFCNRFKKKSGQDSDGFNGCVAIADGTKCDDYHYIEMIQKAMR